MTYRSPRTQRSPSIGDEPEPKRRKVRKGTQSCWECKRRKVRCIFMMPTDSVCKQCRRRGAICISQEFVDQPVTADSRSSAVEERLARVEARLVGLTETDRTSAYSQDTPSYDIVTPTEAEPLSEPKPSRSTTTIHSYQDPKESSQYDGIRMELLAAWPRKEDFDLILRAPVEISVLQHMGICVPAPVFPTKDLSWAQELLQLPPSGSHPVLIAKSLLILASFLQAIPFSYRRELEGLSISRCHIMSHIIKATSLITSNDELMGSIEGIECIMIDGLYHKYEGTLRRSWLSIRRAMMMGQLMGLQRGVHSPSLKMLEPETRTRVNPKDLWFCLVDVDRYLSLMLGLPQGFSEDNFDSPRALQGHSSWEQMRRIACTAAGRILQRNHADVHNFAMIQEIDILLQRAAACMPSQWWLPPELASASSHNIWASNKEFDRLMDQMAYHHLLVQLHLPYMLRFSADRKYDYSKITTVNSSRELLSRFVNFRRSNPPDPYCRGIDFVAFIASTTLCLAHINANSYSRFQDNGGSNVLSFLTHQRLSDRGMMERALEALDAMACDTTDAIASKISDILQHLLTIEADVAKGSDYHTSSSSAIGQEELHFGDRTNGSRKELHIYIPYFGTIKIESSFKHSTFSEQKIGDEQQILGNWKDSPPQQYEYSAKNCTVPSFIDQGALGALPPMPDFVNGTEDFVLQGVDTAFFDSLLSRNTGVEETEVEPWG